MENQETVKALKAEVYILAIGYVEMIHQVYVIA